MNIKIGLVDGGGQHATMQIDGDNWKLAEHGPHSFCHIYRDEVEVALVATSRIVSIEFADADAETFNPLTDADLARPFQGDQPSALPKSEVFQDA